MRKLAIACVSVAAAVFLSFYLFPLKLILPLALLCAAAAVILLPFRQRGDAAERAFLCALGAAVGFGAYSLHWNTTMRYAEQWDGTEQTMTACVMERSSSRNSFAPGMGSIFAMVAWISFRPRPCCLRMSMRWCMSLS